jgi:hypothetical protein
METVVGAIAIAFVLWWLAEEFQQIACRNRALEFGQWWRRRSANLLSLRELIGEDRRVIAVPFKVKDYRIDGPGRYKTMTLDPHEFIRRFS